ncbi:glutamine synthetase family protein [Thioflexithrix psekupsensis]|uniref:Glutamine synthetase n=1 Tax=Thioflexithrix psekupsensis TaxID=1570016 RepID=A0A251X8F6_9GAMM|nr:glutamine synthetase family protein [Thioflexithrix psekupsensis]OUD13963.1 glutamine synthetase [Thioflexithrix psekupsensis]
MDYLLNWIKEHNITEIECLVPDMSGIARGKIIPANKFSADEGMRLPENIFVQTVTGEYPDDESVINPAEIDMQLHPDSNTIRVVPWAHEPTAQVIHDCYYRDGEAVDLAPRTVLRRILNLYEQQGWLPVVAPELEFFLVKKNIDPDYPLEPPIGRSGRPESARQSYGIDAVNEFDPLFEDIYDYCEAQRINIDTLIHEAGAAQMEINFLHGDALEAADQVFLFKRTVREAALRRDIYATFMAKPMQREPGSAMHIHQSLVDRKTGQNLFANTQQDPTPLFLHYLGGLQKYLPVALCFFAPNVNSYRRFLRYDSAPINVQWGYDNRTVGLRVPHATPAARRVENRVAGADANPYLALAASLACGYLGIQQQLTPQNPVVGSGYKFPYEIPRNLEDSLRRLDEDEDAPALRAILGERFVKAYQAVKWKEYETFLGVISSWERNFLLLNV